MENLYYIQKHGYVGNSILWWKYNNAGYTTNIDQARVFTEDEAKKLCKDVDGCIAWNKDHIDNNISKHVDMQNVSKKDFAYTWRN